MSCKTQFKVGDTIPFVGRIEVRDDGELVEIDFSTWSFSCQWKNEAGAVIYTVPEPLVNGGPVIDCSLPAAISAVLSPRQKVLADFRARDAAGVVKSTETRTYRLEAAISEVP
jgi:hypothetical protein